MYLNQKFSTELIIIGRIFYGLAIAGIGLMHFFYVGFRPLILPISVDATSNYTILVYMVGAYLLLSGILLTAGKRLYTASLVLGIIFLLFLVVGHLPFYLLNYPDIRPRGINTFKLLALSGGAFVIAHLSSKNESIKTFSYVDKFTVIGSYFFAIMLILFGTGHLISTIKISALVPPYIPFPVFWTYLSGVALIASGLSILFKFKLQSVGFLLALMLFLWLLMLHLYYAFRFPAFQDGENIIGSFQCLAFCGIALLVSQLSTYQNCALKAKELAH